MQHVWPIYKDLKKMFACVTEDKKQWGESSGSHSWDYYLGTLSCSEVSAIHLR